MGKLASLKETEHGLLETKEKLWSLSETGQGHDENPASLNENMHKLGIGAGYKEVIPRKASFST